MYRLQVGPDWSTQIERIRDANTDDTNLTRFGNNFYRICRDEPGSKFELDLLPTSGRGPGILLRVNVRDLYVTKIAGLPIKRYASTLMDLSPSAFTLDDAISRIRRSVDPQLFELQSLIVFCVAESIRNDHIASAVGQMIEATLHGIVGVPPRLNVAPLLEEARAWEQTSRAVVATLPEQMRSILAKPRASLSAEEAASSSVYVDPSRIDFARRSYAKRIKVLARP